MTTSTSLGDRRAKAAALARRQGGNQKPFEVRNAAEPSGAVMYLYGAISSWGWGDTVSAKSVIKALNELEVDHLDVHVHSPGGDAFEGIAILNAFRNHKATITMHVDGLAASAASFIAMAGDEIVMGRGSQMMIHDASMLTWGNAAQLRDDADWLDKQSQNIATIYADRAGGAADEWRSLMKAETWYSADEAVAAGLADRVAGKAEEDPAAEETAVPENAPDPTLEDSWDLSVFTYAGRTHAPAPAAVASRSALKPPTASADGSIHTEGGSAVAFSDEQVTTMRQKLGLPENADEATILAALDEALEEGVEAAASNTAQAPEGMVLVDSAVLDELRSGAEAGRAARQELDNQARDRAIDDAISAGKTTPARREHWVTSWTADPEGTKALLDTLQPGLAVPTTENGHGGAPEASADDALYAELFGDEKTGA